MTSLAGRKAVVTGAGRGIGRQTALALAASGAVVAALARTPSDLSALQQESGGGITGFVCDVGNAPAVKAAFEEIAAEIGHPDLLVNSAGCAWFGPTLEMPDGEWERELTANLTGVYNCCMAAIPAMLEAGAGDIVNVLSVSATLASAGSAAYSASKFGALGLTRALNAEYRALGVRVLALLPGATDTTLWEKAGLELDRSRMISPADIAETILWMVSRPRSVAVDEVLVMPREGFL